jgi:hypothetical protein
MTEETPEPQPLTAITTCAYGHGQHLADRVCPECAYERALVRARGERREALPMHRIREGAHARGYAACMAVLVEEGLR